MQVLYRIRHIVSIAAVALLLYACGKATGTANSVINLPEIEEKNGQFKSKKGLLYSSDTLFTGLLIKTSDETFAWEEIPYTNGVISGTSFGYYNGKKRAYAREYVNGKKQGTHKMWYPSGQLKSEGHYETDFYQGNLKVWNEDGSPIMDFNYVDGQEVGQQKMWYADGRVKANYVVRNGRRYGLTGVKNCVNVFED